MSVITGFLEIIGVGLVFPLLILLVKPDSINEVPYASDLLVLLGDVTGEEMTILLIALIAIIMFLKAGYMVSFYYFQAKILASWKAALSKRLMRIYLYSDFKIHMQKNSAEIIRNLSLSSAVLDQYIVPLINIGVNIIIALCLASLLVAMLPYETFFGIIVLVVVSALMYVGTRKYFGQLGKESNDLHRQRQLLMQQSIGAIKESKVKGVEGFFIDKFFKIELGYFSRQGRYNFIASLPPLSIETAIILSMLALIGYTILSTEQQSESIAVLGLLAAAMFRLSPIANRILTALNLLSIGKNSVDIIAKEVIELEARVISHQVREGERFNDWQYLHFANVSYDYPDGTLGIKNLTVKINKNEFIGITGPSGGGKSTFLMMVLGLLAPTEGDIRVDETLLAGANRLRRWQNGIGFVPQGFYIFDAPLSENIAYSSKNIDEGQVLSVIKQAHLHEYIKTKNDDIHSGVGENGGLLSGGQKQRVVIARALYQNPDILAFDEATSALDVNIEKAITDEILALKGNKTIFAIAHRLSTLRHCDRILVMDKGEVVDFGSFEELSERCKMFQTLVQNSNL